MRFSSNHARPIAAGLALAAAGLAACHPPHVRQTRGGVWGDSPYQTSAALNCPDRLSALTLSARDKSGEACDYVLAGGGQVRLQRLALGGQTPQAALAAIETSLRPLVPPRGGPEPAATTGQGWDDEQARVDLPGIHVRAQGDQAEVKVFGVTVNANGRNADVNVGHGSSRTVVLAGPNGAEVRGEDIGPTNAKLFLVLTAENPGPSGLHAVGYMARGPRGGPLIVATFKAYKAGEDWRGDADLNRLLALNARQ
jgi:hypothetical protein